MVIGTDDYYIEMCARQTVYERQRLEDFYKKQIQNKFEQRLTGNPATVPCKEPVNKKLLLLKI